MTMGFHEKSAWACMLTTIAIYIPYFWVVFQYPMAYIGLFVLAVICQVVLLVVFHIAVAIRSRNEQSAGMQTVDELDRIVEWRAAKFSGVLLAVVVLIWTMAAMLALPSNVVSELQPAAQMGDASSSINLVDAMIWVHLLFAGFVVSNVIYYASIVVSYRRLAHG